MSSLIHFTIDNANKSIIKYKRVVMKRNNIFSYCAANNHWVLFYIVSSVNL